MRIAYFTQTPRMGGAERVLEQMARAAVEAGHEVVVMTPERFLVEHVQAVVPGAAAVEVGDASFHDRPTMPGRAAVLARQLPAVFGALRRSRADVLHVSNGGHPGSGLALVTLPLARAAGIRRRVLSIHAAPKPRDESIVAVQAGFDRLAWTNADVVAVATHFVGARLTAERGMPPELMRLVPYGVADPGGADGAGALRAAFGVPADAPLALMVAATSDEQKGHAVLIEALGRVPGAYGLFAGATPPAAALDRLSALGLGERVKVAGRLDDVGAAYHAADAVVVPSVRDESLPLVVLEAMATGTPVLASRLSGLPEAVEDGITGHLFAPGDVASLAALLEAMVADRAGARALGATARERWSTRWSETAMGRATLALYS